MLRLFRKIRFQLFSKKKWWNYLLYGIGELFLIVVGILIAIQINNQNEIRKARQLEESTLFEIKKALNKDLGSIKGAIQLYEQNINTSNAIINNFSVKQKITERYADSIGTLIFIPVVPFNKSGYKLLEDRGLDLVRNDSLRTAITDFYEVELKMVEYFFNYSKNFTDGFHQWLQENYYPLNGFAWKPYSYAEIKDHEKVIGDIHHRKNAMEWMLLQLKNITASSEKIVQKIELEIN